MCHFYLFLDCDKVEKTFSQNVYEIYYLTIILCELPPTTTM